LKYYVSSFIIDQTMAQYLLLFAFLEN